MYRISSHISRIFRSENEPETRGATYMRGKNIVEVNGQQCVNIGPRLWVRLICECDLYAKIYGSKALRYIGTCIKIPPVVQETFLFHGRGLILIGSDVV